MAGKGVTGAESAIHGADRLPHLGRADCRAEGQIACGQPLGDRHDVGFHAIFFQSAPRARATGAAHHFIRDHQDAIFRADVADPSGIANGGRDASACRADHGFKDEGGYGFGAVLQDGRLKFGRTCGACRFGGGTGDRAVGIGG